MTWEKVQGKSVSGGINLLKPLKLKLMLKLCLQSHSTSVVEFFKDNCTKWVMLNIAEKRSVHPKANFFNMRWTKEKLSWQIVESAQ